MTLQDQLDAFKADFRAGRPPYNAPAWMHPLMDRATNELLASGKAKRALVVGDRAPEFVLSDQNGYVVSSAELLSTGPLIVSFYRGAWCPYSSLEQRALQQALPAFYAFGANLVSISPQNRANSLKAARLNELEFPLLTDHGNEVASAFGLCYVLPAYLIELFLLLKTDLTIINDDGRWTLPMFASYVIAPDSEIIYAAVDADYTRRPEPTEMLPVLAGSRRRW